jgi:hypothetical protein
MSLFASGLFAPFIVTKILTTLGATFFTIGAKLVPSFTSRASGVLSTWTFSGAVLVPLASSPLLRAKPVARESADPPNKRMLITSGLSDFLVIDTFVWLFAHYGPTELTNALLEYYKTVRNRVQEPQFRSQDSEFRSQNSERAARNAPNAETPLRRYADPFSPAPLRRYADPFLLQLGNENWSLKCNLFAIATRSAAIDDEKFALLEKRKQSVVPHPFGVVDAFTSLGEKDAHRPFVERPRGCNNGKVRVFGKRYERLAPERMALHDSDFERQWSRFAAKQAE